MKNDWLKGLGIAFLIVCVIGVGYLWIFADGKIQAKYNNSVGTEVKDSERNMYTHSTQFVESKVQDLVKEKLELSKTTDKASRKAIIDYLVSGCSQLDANDINDKDIKSFLLDLRAGKIE